MLPSPASIPVSAVRVCSARRRRCDPRAVVPIRPEPSSTPTDIRIVRYVHLRRRGRAIVNADAVARVDAGHVAVARPRPVPLILDIRRGGDPCAGVASRLGRRRRDCRGGSRCSRCSLRAWSCRRRQCGSRFPHRCRQCPPSSAIGPIRASSLVPSVPSAPAAPAAPVAPAGAPVGPPRFVWYTATAAPWSCGRAVAK